MTSILSRPQTHCVRNDPTKKLKFLPNRVQSAPPRARYIEPRLLTTLKSALSEVEDRGEYTDVENMLHLLDRKQNNISYDVVQRGDCRVIRRARACPQLDYGQSVIVRGNLDQTSRHHITVILLSLSLRQHEQVIKTHVARQHILRTFNQELIESHIVLKQLTSLVKITFPNTLVMRAASYVEVTRLEGHTVHIYPVIVAPHGNQLTNAYQLQLQGYSKDWLMVSGVSHSTWEPWQRVSKAEDCVCATFHRTVQLLAELRMLHSLHIRLDEMVALATAAITDHIEETKYTGSIPLQHAFSLSLRLLLHTVQSTRVIRHPVSKHVILKKFVLGRSEKHDQRVHDVVKVCTMFNDMEQEEEFEGLFPKFEETNEEDKDSISSDDIDF